MVEFGVAHYGTLAMFGLQGVVPVRVGTWTWMDRTGDDHNV